MEAGWLLYAAGWMLGWMLLWSTRRLPPGRTDRPAIAVIVRCPATAGRSPGLARPSYSLTVGSPAATFVFFSSRVSASR